MTVRVAIDLALDRLFTYEVPEALQEKLAVGQLLSVPFGHREAHGFAMEVGEPEVRGDMSGEGDKGLGSPATSMPPVTKKSFQLRPVTAIVDETPFFSEHLLALVKRVAAYTAAPLESVLKAALPAAVLKKNVRPRELLFVEPALGAQPVRLTKRQQWLYDQLVRLGGGWLSQLCDELKTTPASLKQLGLLGLAKVAVRARRRDPLAGRRVLPTKPLPLNAEQKGALKAIERLGKRDARDAGDESRSHAPLAPHASLVSCGSHVSLAPRAPHVLLLFGVTGSGKTEVYLQAIARELEAGRGAIVMVPEISLTPQTVRRFASRFGDRVAVLHSALSDGERYDEWHRIRAGEARVVVGPRSAVWAPVRNLGLIVVDEEHEGSYKQDETPRYHARDVAVLRGALEGATVVLGSATPSLESWANVRRGKYAFAEMTARAGAGTLPSVRLVDRREARAEGRGGGAIFSPDLLEAIRQRLDRHEQTILFLNRRGYSKSVTCADCGFVVTCPNCSTPDRGVPYTYHRADACLRCHVCGDWTKVPDRCPDCGGTHLDYRGVGTQRAEAALAKCFPHAKILRMDADSTSRKTSHDDILGAFGRQEADILIGTQMIAKGLDFPNVTLVGVLNADSSLNLAGSDFRAAERTYQLISQVAGRAGRAELPGEVYVQTYDPSEPAIALAARGDFRAFAEAELKVREACDFPPFCRLAVVRFRSQDLRLVGDWAQMYAKSLMKWKGLNVSEAMPSALEKADGWYRWMLVVRAASAAEIARAWRWISAERPPVSGVRIAIDIDAVNLV